MTGGGRCARCGFFFFLPLCRGRSVVYSVRVVNESWGNVSLLLFFLTRLECWLERFGLVTASYGGGCSRWPAPVQTQGREPSKLQGMQRSYRLMNVQKIAFSGGMGQSSSRPSRICSAGIDAIRVQQGFGVQHLFRRGTKK